MLTDYPGSSVSGEVTPPLNSTFDKISELIFDNVNMTYNAKSAAAGDATFKSPEINFAIASLLTLQAPKLPMLQSYCIAYPASGSRDGVERQFIANFDITWSSDGSSATFAAGDAVTVRYATLGQDISDVTPVVLSNEDLDMFNVDRF